MSHMSHTLGIDFGTSNSAAGILVNNRPYLIEVEPGEQTLPTSVFFDFENRKTSYGSVANRALINGLEGRFMRSLKSVLGTPLMHEPRRLMGETLTFVDIIGRFLGEIKRRAETACQREFPEALSGRPVHFHSNNAQRDVQALRDLRECYERAGFRDVTFMNEPEAAALASGALAQNKLGLIVDIGGGTSDFTVFRTDPQSGLDVLASYGVRVGGTDFDKSISFDTVMPLFGRGHQIRKELGDELLTAPNAIYQDLATWERIPFLYTAETRRAVAQLVHVGVEPVRFKRLATILRDELGHEIAFAVERAKIAANKSGAAQTPINLSLVEKHLAPALAQDDLRISIAPHAQKIRETALETLNMAGCRADQIDTIIFVGGSSLMRVVEQTLQQTFPKADQIRSNAFTGIVDGLAIASANPPT